jgi:DedD protein
MGYTSGTAMEDRGLRDIERWRDKIEVRLDNRQVFFLFFGSALVACMLFVLGVIVGKRLESRGRAVSPEIEDPLALLDKVATSPRPAQSGVTFPQALFGAASKASASDKHAKKAMLPAATTPEEEPVARKPPAVATHEAKVEEGNALAAAAPVTETKLAPAKPMAKLENKPMVVAIAEKSSAPATSKAKPAEVQETKPAVIPPVAKPAAIPTVAASSESKSKGRFALQLSSFQDKERSRSLRAEVR